jgi:hypothetical protein
MSSKQSKSVCDGARSHSKHHAHGCNAWSGVYFPETGTYGVMTTEGARTSTNARILESYVDGLSDADRNIQTAAADEELPKSIGEGALCPRLLPLAVAVAKSDLLPATMPDRDYYLKPGDDEPSVFGIPVVLDETVPEGEIHLKEESGIG